MENTKYPHKERGEELRQLRGDQSKREFAKELCVSLPSYYRYEKGQRKIPDGLLKLAKILRQQYKIENDEKWPVQMPGGFGYQTEEKVKIADLMARVAKIMESDTLYCRSLALLIRALHRAIRLEKNQQVSPKQTPP